MLLQAIGSELSGSNLTIPSLAKDLIRLATGLNSALRGISEVFESANSTQGAESKSTDIKTARSEIKKLSNQIDILKESNEISDSIFKKLIQENELKLAGVSKQAESLQQKIEKKLEEVGLLYEKTKGELEKRELEITTLLGTLSGHAIAGSYEKGVADEKNAANWLRIGSIFCMGVILVIVAVTLWESTQGEFNLRAALFRAGLAFLISIPSAYLARESTKHRTQQYSYHQKSLDLKAISPFIASLPQDQQDKIKFELSSKIFANSDKNNNDTFPINSHEIMMEIIKKLDFKK